MAGNEIIETSSEDIISSTYHSGGKGINVSMPLSPKKKKKKKKKKTRKKLDSIKILIRVW